MTGVDVEHTKALTDAATPGPWSVNGYGNLAAGNRPLGKIRPAADAEFIAHARTAVPALVAAVERAQSQVDAALRILEEYDISEEEDFHQCATEDRWRLYRDLTAVLKPEALEPAKESHGNV